MSSTAKWLMNNLQNIITFGSILLAVSAWFFMMNGIPERVSTLEKDVAELKTNLAAQNTKLDMTLNAVYEIRAVLLRGAK